MEMRQASNHLIGCTFPLERKHRCAGMRARKFHLLLALLTPLQFYLIFLS